MLKQNSRGSISSMVKPETGQAKREENTVLLAAVFGFLGDRRCRRPAPSAVSKESARRCSMPGLHHDAVHHHLDIVLELFVQRRDLADLVDLAVDLGAGETLALQLGQLLAVLALAAAHDRRQQQQPRAFRHRHHAVDHLADGLASMGRPVAGE